VLPALGRFCFVLNGEAQCAKIKLSTKCNPVSHLSRKEPTMSDEQFTKACPLTITNNGGPECIITDTATGQQVIVHNEREAQWLCSCLSHLSQSEYRKSLSLLPESASYDFPEDIGMQP